MGKYNYGKCWGRNVSTGQGFVPFLLPFLFRVVPCWGSSARSWSLFQCQAQGGLQRDWKGASIKQYRSKIACWKKHMPYVCFYLVNGLKRRSTTLKWRSNDPGYILIKRDAQSLQQLNIMILPLIRYAKMIRYATPKNVLYVMEVTAKKSKPTFIILVLLII